MSFSLYQTIPMKLPHANVTRHFALLRCVVGFLGEQKQGAWWDCGFLDSTGIRFLETTFPRTARSAAVRSTCEAAGIVHDAAIGRLRTFHLFRLPVTIEDRIEAEMEHLSALGEVVSSSPDEALTKLAAHIETPLQASRGPVQIGTESNVVSANAVSELAAHYHSAFTGGFRCFPYFAASHASH